MDKIVKDRWSGISLGLENQFRLIEKGKRYFIFNYTTGEIIEYVKREKCLNDLSYYEKAMERLYEINGIERKLSKEVKLEIDLTS